MTVVEVDRTGLDDAADAGRATARAERLLAALPPMDVEARADRVRARCDEAGCDVLVVTKLTNVRWLTGFTGSAGILVVTDDGLTLVTDGRYATQSEAQLAEAGVDAGIEIGQTTEAQREAVVAAVGGRRRVGLEAEAVTWAQQRRFDDDWFADGELVPTERLIDDLRVPKDVGEVARIEAAAAIADAALARIRHRLTDGPTEAEFALELDTEMRRLGAQGPSFETICAAGPNGAMPHHRPSPRPIVTGDLVVLDFGALVDGYCSDMTRTVVVGEPSDTQSRMLDVVAASQRAGVEAVAPGVEASAVDTASRDVIDQAGWGEAFRHSTGHGVGLEIHEAPRVAQTSTATLLEASVVTVEPGVYLPPHGGVRIEDSLLVTATGCRQLTLAPKATAVG